MVVPATIPPIAPAESKGSKSGVSVGFFVGSASPIEAEVLVGSVIVVFEGARNERDSPLLCLQKGQTSSSISEL